jgi:hypothetical protein
MSADPAMGNPIPSPSSPLKRRATENDVPKKQQKTQGDASSRRLDRIKTALAQPRNINIPQSITLPLTNSRVTPQSKSASPLSHRMAAIQFALSKSTSIKLASTDSRVTTPASSRIADIQAALPKSPFIASTDSCAKPRVTDLQKPRCSNQTEIRPRVAFVMGQTDTEVLGAVMAGESMFINGGPGE